MPPVLAMDESGGKAKPGVLCEWQCLMYLLVINRRKRKGTGEEARETRRENSTGRFRYSRFFCPSNQLVVTHSYQAWWLNMTVTFKLHINLQLGNYLAIVLHASWEGHLEDDKRGHRKSQSLGIVVANSQKPQLAGGWNLFMWKNHREGRRGQKSFTHKLTPQIPSTVKNK